MKRRHLASLAVAGLALVSITTGPALAGGTPGYVGAALSGAQEVPPADPDGYGSSGFNIDVAKGRICYGLSVANIAPATAAHIHRAPAGSNGPVVIHLVPPTHRASAACTSASPALLQAILDTPSNYYVNVHNAQYPGGAVRGQLV